MFDYLIVGAGFAGSVCAERLANMGRSVLICDTRNHIGGNAFDHYDDSGVLVHKYGPHIFHTAAPRIFRYLSQFTAWRPYEHRVVASVEGKLLPFPINIDTVNGLYDLHLDANDIDAFFASRAEAICPPADERGCGREQGRPRPLREGTRSRPTRRAAPGLSS